MAAIPIFLEVIHNHHLYAYDVYPTMLQKWTAFASSLDAFIKDETFKEYKNKTEELKDITEWKYRDIVAFIGAIRHMRGIVWDMEISIGEKFNHANYSDQAVQQKLEVWRKFVNTAREFFTFVQNRIKGSATYDEGQYAISYTLDFW